MLNSLKCFIKAFSCSLFLLWLISPEFSQAMMMPGGMMTGPGLAPVPMVPGMPGAMGGPVMMTPGLGAVPFVPGGVTAAPAPFSGGTNNDFCPLSTQVDGKYACNPTITSIQNGQTLNMVTQIAGSSATTGLSQMNMMSASRNSTGNDQNNYLNAAANTQITSGGIQTSMGLINALSGFQQVSNAKKHEQNANEFLQSSTSDPSQLVVDPVTGQVSAPANQLQDKMIRNLNINATIQEATIPTGPTRTEAIQGLAQTEIVKNAERANNEQTGVQNAAKASGMMSVLMGSAQMMTGGLTIASGLQLKSDIKKNSKISAGTMGLSTGPPVDPSTGGQGTAVIAPSGNQSSPLPAASNAAGGLPDGFGDGVNPNALPSDVPNGGPGSFQAAPPQNLAQGGSGSGLAGGSTSPATDDSSGDAQAKPASNLEGVRYDGGSNGSYSSNQNNRAGGSAGGTDLSNLLEKFLPKQETDKPTNGILSFGQGNSLGSGNLSLLDKNANVFERIHDRYQYEDKVGSLVAESPKQK